METIKRPVYLTNSILADLGPLRLQFFMQSNGAEESSSGTLIRHDYPFFTAYPARVGVDHIGFLARDVWLVPVDGDNSSVVDRVREMYLLRNTASVPAMVSQSEKPFPPIYFDHVAHTFVVAQCPVCGRSDNVSLSKSRTGADVWCSHCDGSAPVSSITNVWSLNEKPAFFFISERSEASLQTAVHELSRYSQIYPLTRDTSEINYVDFRSDVNNTITPISSFAELLTAKTRLLASYCKAILNYRSAYGFLPKDHRIDRVEFDTDRLNEAMSLRLPVGDLFRFQLNNVLDQNKKPITFYLKEVVTTADDDAELSAYVKFPADIETGAGDIVKIEIDADLLFVGHTKLTLIPITRQADYWLVRSNELAYARDREAWQKQQTFVEIAVDATLFYPSRPNVTLLVHLLDLYIQLFVADDDYLKPINAADTAGDVTKLVVNTGTKLTLLLNQFKEQNDLARFPKIDAVMARVQKILEAIMDPFLMSDDATHESAAIGVLKRIVSESAAIEKIANGSEFLVEADEFEIQRVINNVRPKFEMPKEKNPTPVLEDSSANKYESFDTGDQTLIIKQTSELTFGEFSKKWPGLVSRPSSEDETLIVKSN